MSWYYEVNLMKIWLKTHAALHFHTSTPRHAVTTEVTLGAAASQTLLTTTRIDPRALTPSWPLPLLRDSQCYSPQLIGWSKCPAMLLTCYSQCFSLQLIGWSKCLAMLLTCYSHFHSPQLIGWSKYRAMSKMIPRFFYWYIFREAFKFLNIYTWEKLSSLGLRILPIRCWSVLAGCQVPQNTGSLRWKPMDQ